MLVVLALAGLVVLGAVVVLAMGRGGELSEVHPDHPPLTLPEGRPIAGTDAALLRLPRGIWGYHVDITDEALRRLAHALTERDARVAVLEQQLAELHSREADQSRQTLWDDTAETPWDNSGVKAPENHPGEEVR